VENVTQNPRQFSEYDAYDGHGTRRSSERCRANVGGDGRAGNGLGGLFSAQREI
jgi:hypothetical protein